MESGNISNKHFISFNYSSINYANCWLQLKINKNNTCGKWKHVR